MFLTSLEPRAHHLNTTPEAIRSGQFMVSNLDDFSSDDETLGFASLKSLDSPEQTPKGIVFNLFDEQERGDSQNNATPQNIWYRENSERSSQSDSTTASASILNSSQLDYSQPHLSSSVRRDSEVNFGCLTPANELFHLYHPHVTPSSDYSYSSVGTFNHPASSSSGPIMAIDESFTKLFQCLTVAYRGKIASPKWNSFRGMKVSLKEKVRLNNIIWREYHMQFVMHKRPVVVQFASTFSQNHSRPQAVVLEGKYWKRKMESIRTEYQQCRQVMRSINCTSTRTGAGVHYPRRNDFCHSRSHRLRSLSEVDTTPVTSSINTLLKTSISPSSITLVNNRPRNCLVEDMEYVSVSTANFDSSSSNRIFNHPPSTEGPFSLSSASFLTTTVNNILSSLTSSTSKNYSSGSQTIVSAIGNDEFDLEGFDFEFDTPMNADVIQPVLMQLQPTVDDIHYLFDDLLQTSTPTSTSSSTLPQSISRSEEPMEVSSATTFSPNTHQKDVPITSSTILNTQSHKSDFSYSAGANKQQRLLLLAPKPVLNQHLTNNPQLLVAPLYKQQNIADISTSNSSSSSTSSSIKYSCSTSNRGNDRLKRRHQPSTKLSISSTIPETEKLTTPTRIPPSTLPIQIHQHIVAIAPKTTENLVRTQSLTCSSAASRECEAVQRRHSATTILGRAQPDYFLSMNDNQMLSTGFNSRSSSIVKDTSMAQDSDEESQDDVLTQSQRHSISSTRLMMGRRQSPCLTLADGFNLLQMLLKRIMPLSSNVAHQTQLSPGTLVSSNYKISKSALLHQTADLLYKMKENDRLMNEEISRLQIETESLCETTDMLCVQLPATGVTVKGKCSLRLQDWFQQYIRNRCERNWKFYHFSLFLDKLFESYIECTSSINPNMFHQSALTWVEQKCSLLNLRQLVTESLRELSRETSILVNPQSVPQQIHQLLINKLQAAERNNMSSGCSSQNIHMYRPPHNLSLGVAAIPNSQQVVPHCNPSMNIIHHRLPRPQGRATCIQSSSLHNSSYSTKENTAVYTVIPSPQTNSVRLSTQGLASSSIRHPTPLPPGAFYHTVEDVKHIHEGLPSHQFRQKTSIVSRLAVDPWQMQFPVSK